MKFKVGDKVRVIDKNVNHGFSLGTVVTIIEKSSYDYTAGDGSSYWFINDSDLELVQEPQKPKESGLTDSAISGREFIAGHQPTGKILGNPPKGTSGVPKLPESPFKATEQLVKDFTLSVAQAKDKAIVDSLNDLIKKGILEVREVEPRTEFRENELVHTSSIGIVPKFDEYTKGLEEENENLKRQVATLTRALEYGKDPSMTRENYNKLKSNIVTLQNNNTILKVKNDRLNQELEAARSAAEYFRNFLKIKE